MSSPNLSQDLLARIAGWEAIKQARLMVEASRVREASWSPPLLKGMVQEGSTTYRAGMVIKDAVNVDNLCTCRVSRQRGMICAHSVAVGLAVLATPPPSPVSPPTPEGASGSGRPRAGGGSATRGTGTSIAKAAVRRVQRAGPGGDGEPAELWVVLPANFLAAASRGKAMLVFEACTESGRTPLDALPADRPYAFGPEDTRLIDAAEALAGGETPGMLVVSTTDFARLLPVLVGHPRLSIAKRDSLKVSATPPRLRLEARLEPTGELRLQFRGSPPPALELDGQFWVFQEGTLAPASLPVACRDLVRGPMRFRRSEVPVVLARDWGALIEAHEVSADFTLDDLVLEVERPRFRLHLAGHFARLEARLTAVYATRELPAGDQTPETPLWLPDPQHPTRYSARDVSAEQAAQARLYRSGFTGPDSDGRYRLEGEVPVLNYFAREHPRLEREWEVQFEARLREAAAARIERIEPQFTIRAGHEDWFDLGMTFASSSGERFSPADIQRLVLSGQSHTRLRNGRLALIDTGAVEELQQVLQDGDPQQVGGVYRLDRRQAGFVTATIDERVPGQLKAPAAWLEQVRAQTATGPMPCPPLGALDPVLRPYQKEGVAWLWRLRQSGFGGILADEMGLGKTLQTLAFLNSVYWPEAGAYGGTPAGPPAGTLPSLVVCPTSLVFNWEAEAARFVPRLSVVTLHGPDRLTRLGRIPQAHLVITSYAAIRRDLEHYGHLDFDTVILDEAQHIKNRQTQNAQAVKAVRGRQRLVLTGTPLENSVLDLWSIFDFLMPGYLGGAAEFRERYEVPIARDRDANCQARLARRVRPFLLRRLKREVARDLPDKLEQVAYCEMTPAQAEVYRQVLEATRREVLETVGPQGFVRQRMVVLTALLRLRQVCCDLRLLDLPTLEPGLSSAKFELFGELLDEALDGRHRVLVFSQFTRMLGLLRERLETEGIEHCYLDGATVNRSAVVHRFQSRPDIPVFLISLKAGGTGLNLAAADTVIHYDPWWNPAVEAQATDRAHRLGQTRVVTAYKLITRHTVEEKMLKLQARKRELFAGALGDEQQLAERLGWDDIQALLAEDSP